MNYNPQDLKYYGELVNGDKSCKADVDGHRLARPSNKEYIQEYTNYPNTILQFKNEGNTIHPTQKPVDLFSYLIRTYTNEGDTVFDGFAGSCTLAVACINTNRKYICIEREPKYYEAGLKRIKEANAQIKLKF